MVTGPQDFVWSIFSPQETLLLSPEQHCRWLWMFHCQLLTHPHTWKHRYRTLKNGYWNLQASAHHNLPKANLSRRKNKSKERWLKCLPPVCIILLLHFWVGHSLCVIPKWALTRREPPKTTVSFQREHAQTSRPTPISLKDKALGSSTWLVEKTMFTPSYPPLWLGGP